MERRQAPVLDMTPDGEFRPVGFRIPWPTRVFLLAVGVSLVAGVIAGAALLIYITLLLIPVALAVLAIGYVTLRVQAWRGGKQRTVVRF